MPDTYKMVYQGQPTNSATIVYTAHPLSTIIRHIRVSNPDSSNHTIALWQNGTTNAYSILPATTILAGGWAEFDGTITMASGDTIAAQADTSAKITLSIYGDEVS